MPYDGYDWNWGGSQGSYDSAATAPTINYITAGSGLTMNVREYHHDNQVSAQSVAKGLDSGGLSRPPVRRSQIAIAMWGTAADIPGIVSLVQDSVSSGLNYVKWVEGINEPDDANPSYGNSVTPSTVTTAVQIRFINRFMPSRPMS